MISIKNIPIKTRLALQFTLFLAVIIGILSTTIYYLYIQNSRKNEENIMQIEYDSIKNSIDILNYTDEGLELKEQTLEKIDRATNLGLLIFIFDGSGNTVVSPSSIDTEIPKGKLGHFDASITGQPYQFYSGNYKGLSITIGMSEQVSEKNARDLKYMLFFIWIISSILSFGIGYIFSARALQPIKRLISEVHGVNILKMDEPPIRSGYSADEIGMLADAFDGFIARIRETFHREKEFSQDASHELRTPLMVIRSSLELLENQESSAYQQEKIAMMHEASEKMEHLINELLFLERNMEHEQKSEIRINDFLTALIPSFYPLAEKKGLSIRSELRTPLTIQASPFLLERVFGNLIKNAIFYTDHGSVTIKIEENTVIIEDTGIGMDEKELQNIWNRFYRVEKSRNREQGGSGLGLAIVRKVVDSENWKIEIDSIPGKGTKFTLRF